MIQQVHATVNLASSAVRVSSLPWMVARTYLAICVSQNSLIQDRSIYEDAHIFARALRDMKIPACETIGPTASFKVWSSKPCRLLIYSCTFRPRCRR